MRNVALNESFVKKNVKFLFSVAKSKGLVSNIMAAAGVTNVKSLQWSYQNGRISQEQVDAYVTVLGVPESLVIGEREITDEDKVNISQSNNDNLNEECNEVDFNSLDEVYEALVALVENSSDEELVTIKTKLTIVYKKIEIRELESSLREE